NGQLTINKAHLTVSAENASREYGDANPSFSSSYSGFKNSETLATSGVTGTPSLTTAATPASSVAGSPYAITAAVGTLTAANYDFTFVNGQLIVNAAPLTVTPANASREYGDANPSFSGTITGIKIGRESCRSYISVAIPASAVGSYDITASLSDPDHKLGNYTQTLNKGILTVNAAP